MSNPSPVQTVHSTQSIIIVMNLYRRCSLLKMKSYRMPLSLILGVMVITQTMLVRTGPLLQMRIRYMMFFNENDPFISCFYLDKYYIYILCFVVIFSVLSSKLVMEVSTQSQSMILSYLRILLLVLVYSSLTNYSILQSKVTHVRDIRDIEIYTVFRYFTSLTSLT